MALLVPLLPLSAADEEHVVEGDRDDALAFNVAWVLSCMSTVVPSVPVR
jgi:hypothetical protein